MEHIGMPIYKHTRTGGEYVYIGEAQYKNANLGVWLPVIVYQSMDTQELYVRGTKDFYEFFERAN